MPTIVLLSFNTWSELVFFKCSIINLLVKDFILLTVSFLNDQAGTFFKLVFIISCKVHALECLLTQSLLSHLVFSVQMILLCRFWQCFFLLAVPIHDLTTHPALHVYAGSLMFFFLYLVFYIFKLP